MLKGFTANGIAMLKLPNGKTMKLKDYIIFNDKNYDMYFSCDGVCANCEYACCDNHYEDTDRWGIEFNEQKI